MNFRSMSEEIKYYYKELLSDSQAHTAKALKEYAKARAPRGAEFTDGMMSGALSTLLSEVGSNYTLLKRGVYVLKDAAANIDMASLSSVRNEQVRENIYVAENKTYTEKIKMVLEDALNKTRRLSGFSMEMPSDELMEYKKAYDLVTNSLTKIISDLDSMDE